MVHNAYLFFAVVLLLIPGLGQRAEAAAETNSVGMALVPIPAGKFLMGQEKREVSFRSPWSVEKDTGADFDEQPVRQIEITHPFSISATQVTNAQYEQFDLMHRGKYPNRNVSQEDDAAVIDVSWDDAVAFCRWLSARENKPYRLPTEGEFEYACRAGTTTLFNMGDTLPDGYQQLEPGLMMAYTAYFPATSPPPSYYTVVKKVSLQVAQHPANAWGLFDMHGNVAEWCSDWYAPYDPAVTRDPVGPAEGDFRVLRGGAHSQFARLLRSANRTSMVPWARNNRIGFRVVQAYPIATVPTPMAGITPPPPSPTPEKLDPTKPLFEGPDVFVNIPPHSEGPLFSTHNHDPGLAVCPNGDVLAIWYTTEEENGNELNVASSRWAVGATAWLPAQLFWQCADANNHAPALFVDKNGTLFHFNGNKAMPGSIFRTSTDNGFTWSRPLPLSNETQPSESNIQTADGRILETSDSIFDNAGAVTMSSDGGKTWTKLSVDDTKPIYKPGMMGTVIAGIHVGLIERKDGSLWALGRVDNLKVAAAFDYKLPISISTDGGKTWTYSVSSFPDITFGQRMTLKRLKEGPLLLCTFTDDSGHRDAAGKVTGAKTEAEMTGMPFRQTDGTTKTGYGLLAALSYDDGATWPVRRLVTPVLACGKTLHVQTTDGGSCSLDATHAERHGYIASAQGADGRIHLISSRNSYVFNLAWLTEGTPYGIRLGNHVVKYVPPQPNALFRPAPPLKDCRRRPEALHP